MLSPDMSVKLTPASLHWNFPYQHSKCGGLLLTHRKTRLELKIILTRCKEKSLREEEKQTKNSAEQCNKEN